MIAGKLIEPAVLAWAELRLGKLTPNQYRSAKNLGLPIGCNVDGILNETGEPGRSQRLPGLYGPTDDVFGDEYTDEVPDRVIIQSHGHMLTTAKDVCWVLTFIAFRGLGVFGVWYLAYGRQGFSPGPFAPPARVVVFAARGLVYAVARVAGFDLGGHASVLGSILAVAALALVAGFLVRGTIRRSLPPLAVGGLVAAVGMYGVVGLTRADLASDFATRSRYVYVAAFLLVPAAADLISRLAPGAHCRPWLSRVSPRSSALSIGSNLVDLRAGRAQFTADARLTRAYLTVLAEHRGASWLDPGGLPLGWPDIDQVEALSARYGSPLHDTLIPSDAPPPPAADLDRATLSLALKAFRVVSGRPPSSAVTVVPKVLKMVSATVVSANACVDVTPAPTGGSVTVAVPGGGFLEVSGPAADLTALLGQLRPPTTRFPLTLPTRAGGGATLAVPDLGDGSSWQVRLDFPAGTGRTDVCVFSG